jgi:hypothetical protein
MGGLVGIADVVGLPSPALVLPSTAFFRIFTLELTASTLAKKSNGKAD